VEGSHHSVLEVPEVPKVVAVVLTSAVALTRPPSNSRPKLRKTSNSNSNRHLRRPLRDLSLPNGRSKCLPRTLTAALRLPLPSIRLVSIPIVSRLWGCPVARRRRSSKDSSNSSGQPQRPRCRPHLLVHVPIPPRHLLPLPPPPLLPHRRPPAHPLAQRAAKRHVITAGVS